jgi:N-glycosylase/DNA lyase
VSAPRRLSLRTTQPFELRLALFGHGWIDLAPHAWDEGARRWTTALWVDGAAADVAVTAGEDALRVEYRARRDLAPARVREALARMLRLDLDLEPFWCACDAEPSLAWVRRRGAGRMLRSAHAFEDLMKLLFTTNCSWAATRLMTKRLIDALGAEAPSGARAFPSPEACAREDERFWRDVVRAGYRGRACTALARGFASGELCDEHFTAPGLDAASMRERVLALDGFGPYAAGQALRLFGHHEDLALDSWCRATLAKRAGKRRPPTDRAIASTYRRFGTWQGLALWMDLTAPWHGE